MSGSKLERPLSAGSLLVSDLDGTLLNADSAIAPRTAAALKAAHDRGVHIVAATGRSHRTAAKLLHPLEVMKWAICSNGATLFDLEADDVVSHTFIAADAVGQILSTIDPFPELGFAWETPAGLFRDRPMKIQMHRRYGPGIWDLESEPPIHQVTDQLIKVMVGHPELDHDELLTALRPLIGGDLEISSSGAEFIEITAASAEKGQAVARLATELEVDQPDIVAFGDQMNDLGMLTWVGQGYAMANGHPEVLDATPLQAPHHHEDGVAQVIERLLKLPA